MPLRIVNAEVTVALHAKKCVAARWNRLYWTNSGITTCLIYLLFTTIHYALSYHSVLAYKFTSFSVLKNLIATCSPIIAYFLWLKLLLLLTFTDSIPFFPQCSVGHVVCSSCYANLPDRCHSCSTTGYNRCYIMEHVVDSTKVPCLYDNLGCTKKITYYEKEDHVKVCPHGPCFCPETDCSFYGSTSMLHEHFTSAHMWHCIRLSYNKAFRFRVAQGSTVLEGEDGHLFLVNMVLEPVGGVISLLSIQPNVTVSNFKCKLAVSCPEMSYSQVSQFQMTSTNLVDGLPKDRFLFVVPKVLLRDNSTNAASSVSVSVTLIAEIWLGSVSDFSLGLSFVQKWILDQMLMLVRYWI